MNLRASLLLCLFPIALLGQPSTTMRPALLASLDVEISSSSNETLERGTTAYGSVSVLSTAFSLSGRRSLDATTMLIYGLAYRRHDLDTTTSLLPDQLVELSLNLGLQRRLFTHLERGDFRPPRILQRFRGPLQPQPEPPGAGHAQLHAESDAHLELRS